MIDPAWRDTVAFEAPLSSETIERIQADIGRSLPAEYRRFLLEAGGVAGRFGPSGTYIHLWNGTDLASMNRDYAVDEFAPGLVLFGSDGGDTGLGFDCRTQECGIVSVPFIGMDLREAKPIANSFDEFLRAWTSGQVNLV